MRLLEAFGPRAEDGEDAGGRDWTVSGSQIGLGNEDKSRNHLYLKTLARVYIGPGSEKLGKLCQETEKRCWNVPGM